MSDPVHGQCGTGVGGLEDPWARLAEAQTAYLEAYQAVWADFFERWQQSLRDCAAGQQTAGSCTGSGKTA